MTNDLCSVNMLWKHSFHLVEAWLIVNSRDAISGLQLSLSGLVVWLYIVLSSNIFEFILYGHYVLIIHFVPNEVIHLLLLFGIGSIVAVHILHLAWLVALIRHYRGNLRCFSTWGSDHLRHQTSRWPQGSAPKQSLLPAANVLGNSSTAISWHWCSADSLYWKLSVRLRHISLWCSTH